MFEGDSIHLSFVIPMRQLLIFPMLIQFSMQLFLLYQQVVVCLFLEWLSDVERKFDFCLKHGNQQLTIKKKDIFLHLRPISLTLTQIN